MENAITTVGLEKGKPRLGTFLLGLSMLFIGASGIINEYVLSTVSTYILGNSIEQFGLIIATMMCAMGAGNYFQKKISDSMMIEKFVGVEIFLALLGAFAPTLVYASFATMSEIGFSIVQYSFVISIGFLIGLEIPLVIRINENFSNTLKENISVIMALEYTGSFVGAVLFVKFFLKSFPLPEISFIVAGANLFVATITFLYFLNLGLVKEKRGSLLMITLTVLVLIWGYIQNRDWTSLLEQKLYPDPIVHSETSKYQHLVVTKSRLDEYRLYINGNTQYSSFDERRYHELLIHPAVELSKPENVLLLGAGDGLALREVLKYKSIKSVTLVDLDPAMVKLHSTLPDLVKLNDNAFADSRVRELDPLGLTSQGIKSIYMNTRDSDKNNRKITKKISSVNVFHLDADKFIGAISDRKWNMAVIDLPDPSSVELAKLYSKQFFQKLGKLMTDGGMVSIQATSPYHAKEAYLNIQRTMESAGFKTIPYHLNIPSFGDWGWFLAWNDDRSIDFVKGQIAQMKEFSVETSFLTPDVFRASLVFGKGELESKDTSINTLMSPTLLSIYNEESWEVE